MERRSMMQGAVAAPIVGAAGVATAQPAGRNFVLVHGAWHGGWCWALVADRLRTAGHRVTTPTLTGLGERKHLLSRDITLETFVTDLVNHLEAEELTDVVLVGHSFGGLPITGAADLVPERLRHVVYLDALILQPGQSLLSTFPPAIAEERRRAAEASGGLSVAPPGLGFLGIPEGHPLTGWVTRRMTPHPFGTYDSPLPTRNPPGNGTPCSFIACTSPQLNSIVPSLNWAKQQAGWQFVELPTGHDAMVTAPDDLARLLTRIAE